jgi:pyruvate,water dikinase
MGGDKVYTNMSTGLTSLDKVIQGVIPGDNIIWQVDSIDDYIPFINPFYNEAIRNKIPVIYFRFAEHKPLLPAGNKAKTYSLNPDDGFESFISAIFDVIEEFGYGTYYIFDCLSDLVVEWYSDRMMANFFMLACPYLYDYKTVAYFGILRNVHMPITINAIHNTAQIVFDVYMNKDIFYIHPLKVYKRYSPTMYMLHSMDGEEFSPVTRSSIISEILTSIPQPWLDYTVQRLDIWRRSFFEAQELYKRDKDELTGKKAGELFKRLLRMAITRDARLLKLAEEYLQLSDLIDIGKRMIGTGLIGGKSVGMLVARAILNKADARWKDVLEEHDSFFIGSDVFYTYLIRNGCWWMRRKLKSSGSVYDDAEEVSKVILSGTFPDDIKEQFTEMLNYFGQSPIIVRSSSLLEDAYGNSFSGKYESIFCANQGTPEERLEHFMAAVRIVYSSTMKKEALAYRTRWGLMDQDEQMALLVMRVSGAKYDKYYLPHIAGVGFSYNPYVWDKDIDPEAGMIRLAFGLGTRAVNRYDDDYIRIVALNEPLKRPEGNFDEVKKYTQKRVDILDLSANLLTSAYFMDLAKVITDLPLEMFTSRDEELERIARERNMENIFSHVLTFNKLLSDRQFVNDLREMLDILKKAYNFHVDIEFTANFQNDNNYRINLVQCRPFQITGDVRTLKIPENIDDSNLIIRTKGPIVGNSVSVIINRIIYIIPEVYGKLNISDRYSIARVIGELTHSDKTGTKKEMNIALIGPGRWGTTTPSLGVPVVFSEIDNVSVLCEIAYMHEGLIPDVSLGTHFFNDIVEMNMVYFAIYPDRNGYILNSDFFSKAENKLTELHPNAKLWADVIKVIDIEEDRDDYILKLTLNSMEQEGVFYISSSKKI